MMKKTHNRSVCAPAGFTLIEILIVVAIIAILFTIFLAQVGKAKRRAQVSAVKEGLVTFRIEAQLYAKVDPDGFLHVCEPGTRSGDALLVTARHARPDAADIEEAGIHCVAAIDSFAVDANTLLSSFGLNESFCVDGANYTDAGYAGGNSFMTCTST